MGRTVHPAPPLGELARRSRTPKLFASLFDLNSAYRPRSRCKLGTGAIAMLETLLVRCCAPTLAGIKTGCLFRCPCPAGENLLPDICGWNRRLAGKGVCILPMDRSAGSVLVYVYRPALLDRDLACPAAAVLLRERGYAGDGTACLRQLRRHLAAGGAFPHEIGLFLGYPPEDVRGFLEHRTQGCRCVGWWRVYGDAAAALRLFARYDKCTALYAARHAAGVPLEKLTVAFPAGA